MLDLLHWKEQLNMIDKPGSSSESRYQEYFAIKGSSFLLPNCNHGIIHSNTIKKGLQYLEELEILIGPVLPAS